MNRLRQIARLAWRDAGADLGVRGGVFYGSALLVGGAIGLGVSFVASKLSISDRSYKIGTGIWGAGGVANIVYLAYKKYKQYDSMIESQEEDDQIRATGRVFRDWLLYHTPDEALVQPSELCQAWQKAYHSITIPKVKENMVETQWKLFFKHFMIYENDVEDMIQRVQLALEKRILVAFFKLPEVQSQRKAWEDPLETWDVLLEIFDGHPGKKQLEEAVKESHREFLTWRAREKCEPFKEELMSVAWRTERVAKWIELERWDLLD